MVEPIKLFKKVTIVVISHVILAVSSCMYISLLGLPLCIQSSFKLYLKNLAEIWTYIMTKLNEVADLMIAIVKWDTGKQQSMIIIHALIVC